MADSIDRTHAIKPGRSLTYQRARARSIRAQIIVKILPRPRLPPLSRRRSDLTARYLPNGLSARRRGDPAAKEKKERERKKATVINEEEGRGGRSARRASALRFDRSLVAAFIRVVISRDVPAARYSTEISERDEARRVQ